MEGAEMVQPINYGIQAPSAFESLVSGLKLGTSLQEMQAQRQLREAQAAQIQQKMEADRAKNLAMQEFRAKPFSELTQGDIAGLQGLLPPEAVKGIKDAFDSMRSDERRSRAGQLGEMASVALSGKPDAVDAWFAPRIDAEQDPAQRKALETWKQSAKINPQAFAKTLVTQLSLSDDGREVAKNLIEMYGLKATTENWKPLSAAELKNMGWKEDTQAIRDSVTGSIRAVGSSGTSVKIENEGSIPPGYQAVRDSGGKIIEMRPIPGSPAAAETQARQSATEARAAGRAQVASVVTQEIDRLDEALAKEEQASGLSAASPYVRITGVPGKAFENYPGGARTAAQGFISTIRANIGFEQLSKMRQESPNGAALGNITERELQFLQDTLGAIDLNSDPKVLRQNIKRLREVFNLVVHGQVVAPGEPAAAPAGPAQSATPAATRTPPGQRPPLESFFAPR
jgi:hypothetical protein